MQQSVQSGNSMARHAESVMELDLEKEVNQVTELGLAWAELHEQASLLEETRKTFLAQIVAEIMSASRKDGKRGISFAQAENEALADVRYEAHLREMTAARKEANKSKVRHETAGVRLEMLRSLMANRREEMRLAGFQR